MLRVTIISFKLKHTPHVTLSKFRIAQICGLNALRLIKAIEYHCRYLRMTKSILQVKHTLRVLLCDLYVDTIKD